MKRAHVVVGGAVAFVAAAHLPVRFALTFELLGNAVRTETRWLGPTPRGAGGCVTDIGNVNIWQCSSTEVFSAHAFGCSLWLRVFGYADLGR